MGARALFLAVLLAPVWGQAFDLKAIEKELNGNGLVGEVHGAAHDISQVVFTYREAGNFFNHIEFSLIPANPRVRGDFAKLSRHDKIRIRGRIAPNPSPQTHIRVTSVEVVQAYEPDTPLPAWKRQADLPAELAGGTELLATVHAVAAGGAILVLEYRDTVVPVFVEAPEWTEDLFRGDKVRVQYKLASSPRQPTHLTLNLDHDEPVKLLNRISDIHGEDLELEGPLVYFPKSPMLRFGVFAIEIRDKDGLKVNYTLVNFSDPDVFEAIRNKLEKIWSADTTQAVNGRNCLVKPKLIIRARGTGNMVSPSQANPQILLEGPDSVEVVP